MSEKSRSDIIDDIETHIAKLGGHFSEWYVGVANSPRTALFKRHKLKESGDPWISRKAITGLQAAEVAEYFVSARKTKGRFEDTDVDEIYVYAYKMKPHTKP